ncbi:MAG: DsbA family protein, partial [Gemmatimonadales bacterium]
MTSRLRVPLSERDHVLGPTDAPVTLVEYGDYECPHCGRAHPIVASVLRPLGRQVRFAYRHFPLT